jgi:surface protein
MYLYFYETKQIKEFFYAQYYKIHYDFVPSNKNELMEAINLMDKTTLRYKPNDGSNYLGAHISQWDVTDITDMSYIFCLEAKDSNNQYIYSQETQNFLRTQFGDSNHTHNYGLNNWDMKAVRNMSDMFKGAEVFNQPIGNWETAEVINMQNMFMDCYNFNQDISKWDTNKVTDMSYMFFACSVFDGDITTWDTSAVTNMSDMFAYAKEFNQDINTKHIKSTEGNYIAWFTGRVINMSHMFQGAELFNSSISKWDTGEVTNMESMFSDAIEFNSPIGNWNTSKVEDMKFMFNGSSAFNKNINTKKVDLPDEDPYLAWDTSKVRNMTSMFSNAIEFNSPIENWNTSKVEDMKFMFSSFDLNDNLCKHAKFNKEIKRKAVTFQGIGADSIDVEYSAWDTSEVINMKFMFQCAKDFNQDIGNWNTSKVEDMKFMFFGSSKFNKNINTKKVSPPDEDPYLAWDTSKVRNMTSMFSNAIEFNSPIENWNTSKVEDMKFMFASVDWNGTNLCKHAKFNKEIKRKAVTFQGIGADSINVAYSAWDTSEVKYMTKMFQCAKDFNQDIGNWNTSEVTNMESMFQEATSFNQDITRWATSEEASFSNMFNGATTFLENYINLCSDNSNGPPSCWRNKRKLVNDMDDIRFNIYTAINLMGKQPQRGDYLKYDFRQISFDDYGDVSYDETANHADGYHISDWDINQITDMSYLFSPVNPNYTRETQFFLRSNKLNDLIRILIDNGNWEFSHVTNTSYMFMQAVNFNSDISSWDLSNVTNTQSMFREARSFDQDISNWNISDPNSIKSDCMFSNSGLSEQNSNNAKIKLDTNDEDLLFTDKYLYFYRTNANNNYQSQPIHITRGGNYKIIFANEADTIDFPQYDSYIIITVENPEDSDLLEKNMYIKITRELDENNEVIDNSDINITSSSTENRRIVVPKNYQGLIENGIWDEFFRYDIFINEGFDNVHINNIHMQIDDQDSNDYDEYFSVVSRLFYNPSGLQNSFKECSYLGGTSCTGIVGCIPCYLGGELLVEDCFMEGNLIGYASSGIVGRSGCNGNTTIRRCYFDGNILAEEASGILGCFSVFGTNAKLIIENCYTEGNIINAWCSGIVGFCSCYDGAEMNINGCSFKGDIYFSESELSNYNIDDYFHASQSAGILGSYSVKNSSKCTIDDCQFEGNILYHEIVNSIAKTYNNAGILGYTSGKKSYDPSEIIINNCSFVGNISASSSAGICACYCENVKINNCNFEGNIDGSNGVESIGGIVGKTCRYIEINGCDFFGDINGSFNDTITSDNDYHGGICAYFCQNINIDQCSFKGNISNSTYSGGISGGLNFSITISNSLSMGEIFGIGCGGIVGANSGNTNINFCYFKGDIKGDNCGGIFGPLCTNYGISQEVNLNISNSFSYCNINGNNSSSLIPSLECQNNKLINMLTITNCLFNSQLNSNSLYEEGILQYPNLDTLIQKQIISTGIPFTDNAVINITNCALFNQTSESSFHNLAIETIANNISSITAINKWTICYNHWRLSWENTDNKDECNCNYLINKFDDDQNYNISPTIPTVLRNVILKSCTI